MSLHSPFNVTGFHSCDKKVGLKVLNGQEELIASQNSWDWLGEGIYFWEQDPVRALSYAIESSQRKQFNRIPIKIPFVVGAIINLGNCLNLVESESLQILTVAYRGLKKVMEEAGQKMPLNKENNRALDCKVIQYIHQSNKQEGIKPYDTIRCAFPEGDEAYPGASITSRLHIQICVLNKECIQGFFLPLPHKKFNPNL
ncbi:MAG TPA: hypothetical protein VGP55_10655 [Chitinophagaceae bacterium]|nr:hypothetical protein [Chitinophagaceae bacterium]